MKLSTCSETFLNVRMSLLVKLCIAVIYTLISIRFAKIKSHTGVVKPVNLQQPGRF